MQLKCSFHHLCFLWQSAPTNPYSSLPSYLLTSTHLLAAILPTGCLELWAVRFWAALEAWEVAEVGWTQPALGQSPISLVLRFQIAVLAGGTALENIELRSHL